MIKKKIVEMCMRVAMKEGVKCDAYFSHITSGCKVTINYDGELYRFKTYKEALKFLES